MEVEISNESISFTACNPIRMFYTALADGTFEITDSVVQGDRVCSDDTDRKYLNVLGMANEFVAISNTVT